MAKPRKLVSALPVAGQRLPTDQEIFHLADMVCYGFDMPETAGLKRRLQDDAEAYWDWLLLQVADEARKIAYLLELVFRCPQMFTKPDGCEWMLWQFTQVLIQRRLDPTIDTAFWKAVKRIHGRLRRGRPKDMALDLFRYKFIADVMKPPAQLEGLVKTLKKTEAVDRLAEAEERLFGRSPDTRSIWRSCRRVEEFRRKVAECMQRETLLSQASTRKPRKDTAAHLKKRPTRSKSR